MKWKQAVQAAMLFCVMSLLSTTQLMAENNQTTVIGGSLAGVYTYSQSDDARAYNGANDVEGDMDEASITEIYIEFYLFDDIALGYRTLDLLSERFQVDGANVVEETVEVEARFYTVTSILFGEDSYYRMGVFGGAGSADYTYTMEGFTNETTGEALTYGAFFDFGSDGLGARITYLSMMTNLDPVKDSTGKEVKLDASGSGLSVSFRYAFGEAPRN